MRVNLADIDGAQFDVAIVGAGINGAAAAQELAAAGYRVALFDKGDYGSGSSSRSTRLVHCGLRYLAPGGSPYSFLWHPSRFVTALRMTAKAMRARREFVTEATSQARKILFGFPVWQEMPIKPWHIDVALRIVESVGPKGVALERQIFKDNDIQSVALFRELRNQTNLLAVNTFAEYQFNWPERVLMDMVLDAERMGAVCRNYTPVSAMSRGHDGSWSLTLDDAGSEESATVVAKIVLNTAGIWTDRVNQLGAKEPGRKILGTKGAHIVIKLPPEFTDQGIISFNRRMDEPVYLVPWRRGLHYMGVTETVYEGDIDDIRADKADVDWLLAEFNHLLPGLAIEHSDILSTWAGVRPLTYDPALPKGARSREIHDLTADGLPGVFAVTAGPVTTHRSAGRELRDTVARRIQPSGAAHKPNYAARQFGREVASPALLNHDDTIRLSDLRDAASREHVTTLTDLMTRRTGLVWTETCGREGAQQAAGVVADILGWDEQQKTRQVEDYLAYLDRYHFRPE